MIVAQQKSRLAGIVLWCGFGVAVLALAMTLFNIADFISKPLVRNEQPEARDVIIVLGGGVVTDTQTLPWSVQERVQRGIELYRGGYAEHIIFAGGVVKGHTYSESDIMRNYAEFLGQPAESIIEEPASSSTHENALNTKAIMEHEGFDTALVVTSAYHTKRACAVFKHVGMAITCVAAFRDMTGKNLFRNYTDARAVVREYLATVYYWIRGYLST
ncbi:MAG: YdcF family protein [Patescibacteria group bacterium]|nr:YdcF family protein [Patescibacteria group bacterium]MDD5715572.1 YdcF family protein [Patescibacteria group bacterium]